MRGKLLSRIFSRIPSRAPNQFRDTKPWGSAKSCFNVDPVALARVSKILRVRTHVEGKCWSETRVEGDAVAITRLFYETVHLVNLKHYSEEQVRLGCGGPNPDIWQ